MIRFDRMIREYRGVAKWFDEILFVICLLCLHAQMFGQTYYVDAQTGNDDHSGLSPTDAWKTLRQVNITTFQPGDSILFHAGQEWEGMLYPRGSGVAGRSIVISRYGGDKSPKIHGGHADPVDFEGMRTIQAVLLLNQQYWVISDLEITNMPDNKIKDFKDNGDERRRGISVVASDTGELHNIAIKNNYIHHVKGDDSKDFYGSGGIILSVLGKRKSSFFNGVYILNNRIYMVNRTGIGISSYWQRRPQDTVYPHSWMNEMGPYQANLNVVIRGNNLKSIGGDGIVPQTSFKALIEYNKVDGAASRSAGHNAGLWAWNSDSVLIQYNEVGNTRTVRDGMAFDCDAYSTGHTCQYNYSHDNKGGFMLFHGYSYMVPGAENSGHIIRYNISVNDGNKLLHFYGSGHTRSVIHNNLFYNKTRKVIPIIVDGRPADVTITNNIFYIPKMAKWIGIDSIGQLIFSDNILLKSNEYVPKSNTAKKPMRQDLCRLLNQENNGKKNEPVNLKMICQFWDNIMQKYER